MNSYFSDHPIPAWYELSFDGISVIYLRVHRTALKEISENNWSKSPTVTDYKKRFNLPLFTPPQERDCGFNNVFLFSKSPHPDWIVWKIQLPKLKSISEKPEDTRQYILALRATLNLFSLALWLCEEKTNWNLSQLIIIESIHLPIDDGRRTQGSLSVTLCPEVIRWLAHAGFSNHEHIEDIVNAMKSAYSYMWEGIEHYGRFGALFRNPKWLNLTVPGDACNLDPEGIGSNVSLNQGYTLHPHNVDSTLQQLTFLAGIAALHDLVRPSK